MQHTTARRRRGVAAAVVAAWPPPSSPRVKRPGESDGQCTRGTAGPEDPEYGSVDPPAGQWWADYALGLAQRANPVLVSHH